MDTQELFEKHSYKITQTYASKHPNIMTFEKFKEALNKYHKSFPVELPVKPANGDIPERCTKEFINFLLVNALRNLTGEQREILTKALVERSEYYQKTFDDIIKDQEETKQIIKEIKSRLSV